VKQNGVPWVDCGLQLLWVPDLLIVHVFFCPEIPILFHLSISAARVYDPLALEIVRALWVDPSQAEIDREDVVYMQFQSYLFTPCTFILLFLVSTLFWLAYLRNAKYDLD
jgi:hypothetical protein